MTHDEQREQDVPTEVDPSESGGADAHATEAASTRGASEPVAAPVRPRWLRTVELLLPAVLAAGAMGVHWAVNVPEKIVESPNDQGAKDKKPDKKKKDDRRKRTAKRDETRTPEALDADWEAYGAAPFDEEPTRTTWARRHQVVINRAVVEARRQAFAGAPEEAKVVLASTTCRTVRCRFLLRSPYPHELDLMASTLERLHEAGEPVWRSFEVEPVIDVPDPSKAKAEVEHAVQVTVAFRTDDTDTNALEIPPATPEAEAGEPEHGGEPEPEHGGEPEPEHGGEPEPEHGGEPNEDGEPENGG